MSKKNGYKKQQNLSFVQFLAEMPSFIAILVSAILSRTLLVFVDLIDSFGHVLRTGMITLLSRKLSKNLKYEYNYGIGKIEAISSLLFDGIILLGLLITIGVSIHSIVFPSKPSDLVIAVVGLKVINVAFDIAFYVKQHKILKLHDSAISKSNHAADLAALLFDSVTLVSLLFIWLFRNNPIGGYISPVISIFIAVYLIVGCIKRIKSSIDELTDKTLPEDVQMKILNILTRYFNSYSQVNHVKSHKVGNKFEIDLHLSFENETNYEDIIILKNNMQEEFDKQIGNCTVNIIVSTEQQ